MEKVQNVGTKSAFMPFIFYFLLFFLIILMCKNMGALTKVKTKLNDSVYIYIYRLIIELFFYFFYIICSES